MQKENFIKYEHLRRQHPEFVYESYGITLDEDQTVMEFVFRLGDDFTFKPAITIPVKGYFVTENLSVDILRSLVFNIGMIELVSYWKAACPPKIIIKPHRLDEWQVSWWKKLYYYGLGEFFYLNDIVADREAFVNIESKGKPLPPANDVVSGPTVIVPVGGGKDSAVTLEMLKGRRELIPFAVNPRNATWATITNAGLDVENTLVMQRRLDPGIIKLNEKGYLNGHTPFSALIAFTSILGAVMSGSGSVALSNESSASETTIKDSPVNHQYSKSYEFESDFREYCKRYLTGQVRYFSFLRPLNELQIIRSFINYSNHHLSFRSCNAGSKTDTWCGACPKCLFAYIMLSAFMGQERLMEIFGENLLEKEELIPVLDELTGRVPQKPFECVGTRDEVNMALVAGIRNCQHKIPRLLEYYKNTELYRHYKDMPLEAFLHALDDKHYLSGDLLALLKSSINA